MESFTIETTKENSSRSTPTHLRNGFSSRSWSDVGTKDLARRMQVSALLPRQEKRDLAACRASGRRNDRKVATRCESESMSSRVLPHSWGAHEASRRIRRGRSEYGSGSVRTELEHR